ncbi:MAG: EscU/YscU/HrcU family type III secretion system export apparatus switch protein [Curvibacter sp.]
MDSSSQDRNLPASPRKLQRAKEDGQVARSRDFGHLAVLGGGALALMALAPEMFGTLRLAFARQLSFDAHTVLQAGTMVERLQTMALTGLIGCLIFAAIVCVAAVLGALASGGWVLSVKPITPDITRLSPLQGIKGMFSKKKLAETAKLSFIALFILLLAAAFIHATLPSVAALIMQPSVGALARMFEWLLMGCGLLLAVILLVALVDLPLQNFLHKSELKMSLKEMRDEHKESEGNPQMKSHRRQKAREIAQRSSIKSVPKADFVLMNPTHYAVAVKYDEKTMNAPRVISKGADLLALKIRDIAKSSDVPVLQSPVLARALYAHAELDQDIPTSLYTAVAQVLAYIYRLRAALRGEGPMPVEMPQPAVPAGLDPHERKTPPLAHPTPEAA